MVSACNSLSDWMGSGCFNLRGISFHHRADRAEPKMFQEFNFASMLLSRSSCSASNYANMRNNVNSHGFSGPFLSYRPDGPARQEGLC